MRLIIDLDLSDPKRKIEVPTTEVYGKANRIANAAIQIVRLPLPGERVQGARVGEPVVGRIVVQYVGSATLTVVDDVAEKESQQVKTRQKRAETASRKSPRKVGSGKTKKAAEEGNRKPPSSLQSTRKRR